jgi:hypothetical protein
MSIRYVKKKNGIFDSINCTFIEPNSLCIDKEKVDEYLKTHPFPKDPEYSVEDLVGDLQTTGSWTLPEGIKDETGEFIAEMVYELC